MKITISVIVLLFLVQFIKAEDGHSLWLRAKSTSSINVVSTKKSPNLDIARQELLQGWQGKAQASIAFTVKPDKQIKGDGFKLSATTIQANTDLGILYGVYEMLRRQQTGEQIKDEIINPSYDPRILDHWDNINGTIERGYAGRSIFWRHGLDS